MPPPIKSLSFKKVFGISVYNPNQFHWDEINGKLYFVCGSTIIVHNIKTNDTNQILTTGLENAKIDCFNLDTENKRLFIAQCDTKRSIPVVTCVSLQTLVHHRINLIDCTDKTVANNSSGSDLQRPSTAATDSCHKKQKDNEQKQEFHIMAPIKKIELINQKNCQSILLLTNYELYWVYIPQLGTLSYASETNGLVNGYIVSKMVTFNCIISNNLSFSTLLCDVKFADQDSFITAGNNHLSMWQIMVSPLEMYKTYQNCDNITNQQYQFKFKYNRPSTAAGSVKNQIDPPTVSNLKNSEFSLGQFDNSCYESICIGEQGSSLTGLLFALTSKGILCVFTISGKYLQKWVNLRFEAGWYLCIRSSYIVASGSPNKIRVFDAQSLKHVGTLPTPQENGLIDDQLTDNGLPVQQNEILSTTSQFPITSCVSIASSISMIQGSKHYPEGIQFIDNNEQLQLCSIEPNTSNSPHTSNRQKNNLFIDHLLQSTVCAMFSRDLRRIVSVYGSGHILIWNVENIDTNMGSHMTNKTVSFKLLQTVSSHLCYNIEQVKRVENKRCNPTFIVSDGLFQLRWYFEHSNSSKLLYKKNKLKQTQPTIECIEIINSLQHLILGFANSTLKILSFKIVTQNPNNENVNVGFNHIQTYNIHTVLNDKIGILRYLNNGPPNKQQSAHLLAISSQTTGILAILSANNQRYQHIDTISMQNCIVDIKFQPCDSHLFILTTREINVYKIDANNTNDESMCLITCHDNSIDKLYIHPSNKFLISFSNNSPVFAAWNIDKLKLTKSDNSRLSLNLPVRSYSLPSNVTSLTMDNAGLFVFVGCKNGNIYVLDWFSSKIKFKAKFHCDSIIHLSINNETSTLLSGSFDGIISQWNLPPNMIQAVKDRQRELMGTHTRIQSSFAELENIQQELPGGLNFTDLMTKQIKQIDDKVEQKIILETQQAVKNEPEIQMINETKNQEANQVGKDKINATIESTRIPVPALKSEPKVYNQTNDKERTTDEKSDNLWKCFDSSLMALQSTAQQLKTVRTLLNDNGFTDNEIRDRIKKNDKKWFENFISQIEWMREKMIEIEYNHSIMF